MWLLASFWVLWCDSLTAMLLILCRSALNASFLVNLEVSPHILCKSACGTALHQNTFLPFLCCQLSGNVLISSAALLQRKSIELIFNSNPDLQLEHPVPFQVEHTRHFSLWFSISTVCSVSPLQNAALISLSNFVFVFYFAEYPCPALRQSPLHLRG